MEQEPVTLGLNQMITWCNFDAETKKRYIAILAVQNASLAKTVTAYCTKESVQMIEPERVCSAEVIATGGCKDYDAATWTQATAQLRSSTDTPGCAVWRSPGDVDDSGGRCATKRSSSCGPIMVSEETAAKSELQEEADNQASDGADAEKDEYAPQNILESYGYEAKHTLASASYAVVKEGYLLAKLCTVAIKIVQKQKTTKDYIGKILPPEIKIIKDLHYPHKELIETSNHRMYNTMELAKRDDLLYVMNLRKYMYDVHIPAIT